MGSLNDDKKIEYAIIGGTGLCHWPELEHVALYEESTPYGVPSAPIKVGLWQGVRIAFLPRHGEAHTVPPHAINYRANVFALKQLGAASVIGINAVGGIHAEMLAAAHLVVPDQLIDYSSGRTSSFFDKPGDPLNHIDFTEPYDERVRVAIKEAIEACGFAYSSTGTYACTQGPRLETKAEIRRLEQDGCDIVGMTGMPEAALAREAALRYASLCIVVNPAAGKSNQLITLDEIKKAMAMGVERVKAVVGQLPSHTSVRQA